MGRPFVFPVAFPDPKLIDVEAMQLATTEAAVAAFNSIADGESLLVLFVMAVAFNGSKSTGSPGRLEPLLPTSLLVELGMALDCRKQK